MLERDSTWRLAPGMVFRPVNLQNVIAQEDAQGHSEVGGELVSETPTLNMDEEKRTCQIGDDSNRQIGASVNAVLAGREISNESSFQRQSLPISRARYFIS